MDFVTQTRNQAKLKAKFVLMSYTLQACTEPCPNCGVCENGRCTTSSLGAFSCLLNGTSTRATCPRGYTCKMDECRSYCVPNCTNNDQFACSIDPCSAPRPEGCSDRAICVPNYCGGCTRNFYDPSTGAEVCNGKSPYCVSQLQLILFVCLHFIVISTNFNY